MDYEMDLAANEEEVAEPQEVETEELGEQEVEQEVESQNKPQEEVQEATREEITQTQAFARRLKEEKQKAIDAEYERLYSSDYGIRSKADYDAYITRQKLIEEGKDPELYELKNELESFKHEKKLMQQEEKLNSDPEYGELYKSWKPEIKDRIEQVYNAHGIKLDYETAFTILYKEKTPQIIKDLKKQLQVVEKNTKNAATSTGSLTGNGTVPSSFFTKDQVEAMSVDEVKQNYKAIIESRKQWK